MDKKITMSLNESEAKTAGFDLTKKDFSNQLREKLKLPIPVRESISQLLKDVRAKKSKAEFIELLKVLNAKK